MAESRYPLLFITWDREQPYNYSIGRYGIRLLRELRDNKRIVGIRCPKCGRVYVPPRRVCGRCFVSMEEFVEVGSRGILNAYTVVYFSFIDPETGTQRPVPYGYGRIKLHGADSEFLHFLKETDLKDLRIGAEVEAVFNEERVGSFKDIKYFRVIR